MPCPAASGCDVYAVDSQHDAKVVLLHRPTTAILTDFLRAYDAFAYPGAAHPSPDAANQKFLTENHSCD